MDLDWEGFFADKIGDNAAVALSTFFKKTQRIYKRYGANPQQWMRFIIVQDEKPLVPLKHEVKLFITMSINSNWM